MSSHALAERALDWAREHPLPNGHVVPMCLWGPRGVGKTAWVNSYCQKRKYGLRGYQPAHDSDGTGLTGLPSINESTGYVEYAPPPFLPSVIMEGSSIQEEKGVIFYDEINRGTLRARNALMEPINEDRISQSGWQAPKGWVAVVAANPPEKGYDVEEMDEALMNRMCHLWIAFDKNSWRDWAQDGEQPLPGAVVDYAYNNSGLLATDRDDLPDTIQVPLTPRSMEFLGRLYVPGMDKELLHAFAGGLLGKVPAEGFMAHVAEYEAREFHGGVLTVEHILTGEFASPLAAEIASGNTDNLRKVVLELSTRLGGFQVSEVHAMYVAQFMRQTSSDISKLCAQALNQNAKHWMQAIMEAYHGA